MKKINLILLTLIIIGAVVSSAGDITKVSVRDKNFAVVKVIKDHKLLQQFENTWKEKKKLKNLPLPQWLYKIDIEGKGYGDRWLYDPAGFVQVLTKAKTPVYHIPDTESFNKLIGTHNLSQEPIR